MALENGFDSILLTESGDLTYSKREGGRGDEKKKNMEKNIKKRTRNKKKHCTAL